MSSLPKDMQGSGILGTTAGEEVGLSGLPDRSSVVQLMDFGESPLCIAAAMPIPSPACPPAAALCSS